jgi:hypothetical protein
MTWKERSNAIVSTTISPAAGELRRGERNACDDARALSGIVQVDEKPLEARIFLFSSRRTLRPAPATKTNGAFLAPREEGEKETHVLTRTGDAA